MSMPFSFFHIPATCLLLLVYASAILFFNPARTAAAEIIQPENTINITFDLAGRSMTGTSRITLPANTPLTLFCGPLIVTGAVLEKADQAPLSIQPSPDNIINIPAADAAQTIFISWSLVTAEHGSDDNLIDPSGITLAGIWHPVPDIDMMYSLGAKLPENFTGISEGETLSYCKDASNTRYLSSTFAYPLRAIHFVAGPYTVTYKKMANGVNLAAFFFPEDLHLADAYLERTAAYINRYEKLIGPYPYSRYRRVENRIPTGYGMPTFTLLGQAVIRLPFIKDISLGHEVLHSWFGNSVNTSRSSGNWAEGLTTYLADQLYAEERGEGAAYRKNQLLQYDSYVHDD
ncbi:MAG: hypothetical protein L3J79_11005, partial [Candidatus Marinimicrobia bacterium]|nr:hypothetical protein [Candidatus Neomarinimicrobiota bacterium]